MDRGGGGRGTISLIRRIKLRGFEKEEEEEVRPHSNRSPRPPPPPHPMHEIFEMEIKSRPGRTKIPFPLKKYLDIHSETVDRS